VEEDISSYWKTLRKPEGTGNWRGITRSHSMENWLSNCLSPFVKRIKLRWLSSVFLPHCGSLLQAWRTLVTSDDFGDDW